MKLKVVGLLKEKTEQIYFSEKLCSSVGVRTSKLKISFTAHKRETTTYTDGTPDKIFDVNRNINGNLVINPKLKGDEVRITRNQFVKLEEPKKNPDGSTTTQSIHTVGTMKVEDEETDQVQTLEVTVLQDSHMGESSIIEVSEELFWKLYGDSINEQMTVYIKEYVYTDQVLKWIDKKGYEAISAFRTSALEYDGEAVAEQFRMMAIGLATIVIVFVLFIFVVHSLMKLKRGDFIILTSLGMSYRTVRQMNYYDLISMVIAADIISILIINILGAFNIEAIKPLIIYFRLNQYIIIIVLSVIMAAITAFLFSRHLLKKFRITALKGE